MKWDEGLIYDRTAIDVQNRTSKAFFNISDWLRIYDDSQILNQLVNAYLSASIPFTSLTAPGVTTFPTASEINSLINNIDLLRAAVYAPASVGIVALDHAYTEGVGGTAPDYSDVNAWEHDLILIRDFLGNAVDYRVYCGVASVGQARFYQNRWRHYPWVQNAVSPVRRPRTGVGVCGAGPKRQNSWRKY